MGSEREEKKKLSDARNKWNDRCQNKRAFRK